MSDNTLLDVARRNIRQFIANASFASEADRWSAGQCIDVIESYLSAPGENASVLQPIQMPSDGEIIDAANAAFMDQKDTRQDNDLFYIRTVKSLFLQRIDTFDQPVVDEEMKGAIERLRANLHYYEERCTSFPELTPAVFALIRDHVAVALTGEPE